MAGNGKAIDESQDHQIVICGKSYTLRFSNRAWKALEGLWKTSLTGVYREFGPNNAGSEEVSITKINDLLWCALRTHHKEITMDDVESMLDDAGFAAIPTIFQSVMATMRAGEPPPEVAATTKRPPKGETAKSHSTN